MEGSVPGTENFRWIDFRDPKDAPTVGWVTNQLKAEKWTAIREIGVQWDSALVITTLRKDPAGCAGGGCDDFVECFAGQT